MASSSLAGSSRRPQRFRKPISYADRIETWELHDEVTVQHNKHGRLDEEDYDPSMSQTNAADNMRPAKKTKTATRPFRFLNLPAEIRNQIYSLALVEPNMMSFASVMKGYRRTVARTAIYDEHSYSSARPLYELPKYGDNTAEPASLSPQLLAVCKQIHSEAVRILYGQCFMLANTKALHDLLTTIGLRNQQYLHRLVVKDWGTGKGALKAANYYAFAMLQNARNLQELCLDCNIGFGSDSCKKIALTIYSSLHQFFEHYGDQNGRKDAALDVLRLNDTHFPSTMAVEHHVSLFGGIHYNIGIPDEQERISSQKQNVKLCVEELRKLLLAH